MKLYLSVLAISALLLTGCSAPTPELKYDELDIIKYEKCLEWQPKGEVTYKRIMNITMDLLGQENMVTPIILQSMVKQSEENEIDPMELSVYLFAKDEKIGVAIFKGTTHVKVCPIAKLFE